MAEKSTYIGTLSPEYALLGLLLQRPAHGYELHKRLVDELGQVWHISLSQTYNILNRLETQGFIFGETEDQEKLPARRKLSLTDSGHQRFTNWLHSPSASSVRSIRVEFTTRLYFARSISSEMAHDLINAQICETRVRSDQLKNILDHIPMDQTFNRLGLDLRVRQLNSILGWLENCHDEIEKN